MRSFPSGMCQRSSLNTPKGVNFERRSAWMKRRKLSALCSEAARPYSASYAATMAPRTTGPAATPRAFCPSRYSARLTASSCASSGVKLTAVGFPGEASQVRAHGLDKRPELSTTAASGYRTPPNT